MDNYIKLYRNENYYCTNIQNLDAILHNIICNYINFSWENKNNYMGFTKNYHYFFPYLEFILYEMGYNYENQLLFSGVINIHKDYNNYFQNGKKVLKSDDNNLAIHNFNLNEDYNHNGFIDKWGKKISNVFVQNYYDLAFKIISQHLLHNENLAYEFSYQKPDYLDFCSYRLGYISYENENNEQKIRYNGDIISLKQKEIIKVLDNKGFTRR